MQTCTVCHETKPYSEFHRDLSRSSGYRGRCKTCRLAADRKGAGVRRQRDQARRQQEQLKKRELDEKAIINREAILRLINAHRAEFEAYQNAARLKHDSTRATADPPRGAWVCLA